MTTASIDELPLPRQFVEASGVTQLMPAQQLAVEAGLLRGKDLLVVAATASGKTFIGEMAGIKNYLEGRGRTLFLVPLVALANQKYERFTERYAKVCQVRPAHRARAGSTFPRPGRWGPEPPGPDHRRDLRRGGQHDPLRPEDGKYRDRGDR